MIRSDNDFKRMREKQNIYIYGAQSMANMVYDHLMQNQCKVEGFMVSRMLNNPDFLKGLPVRIVYDLLEQKERICIIVAVLPRFRKEVMELLLHLGFCSIVTLDDQYADRLKKMQDRQFLGNTEYLLEVPEGIETSHAVLRKREGIDSVKWRVDLTMLDSVRQAAVSGAWNDDGLTREYERMYGNGKLVLPAQDYTHDDPETAEEVGIYVIKSHVDKPTAGYVPCDYWKEVQAGTDLTKRRLCDCMDNTGDHISGKNKDFSECTAIYWIWKNGDRKKYTGVYHYRRHLNITPGNLQRLMEKDVTLVSTVPCLMYPSIRYFFVTRFLYEYDWLLMMRTIKRCQPGYYETALNFEKGHFYLANNIFVMETGWFDKMCGFVFSVLLEVDRVYEERHIERQDRYAGYLFEVLYSIFVMHHAKEMRIVYTDMVFLD